MSLSPDRPLEHQPNDSQELLKARQDQFAKLKTLEGLGIFDIIAQKTKTKPYQPKEPQPPLPEEERKRRLHERMEERVADGTAMRVGSGYRLMVTDGVKDEEFPGLAKPGWRVILKDPRKVKEEWDTNVDIQVVHSKWGDGHDEKLGRFDTANVSVFFDGESLLISGKETVLREQVSQLERADQQILHAAFDSAFENPVRMPVPKPPSVNYGGIRHARYKV